MQTKTVAEDMTEQYVRKVNMVKTNLLDTCDKFTNPPSVDSIILAIANRRQNMIQSAQYKTEQQIKLITETHAIPNISN